MVSRAHCDRRIFLEALHHSDKGLVALAILFLNEGLAGWELTQRSQCSLSEIEFAEARAVLSARVGQAANINATARLFDAVVFDSGALEKSRLVLDAVCSNAGTILDILADSRVGSEAEFLRANIISSRERTLPLGATWDAGVMTQHTGEDVHHRALISKQYLNSQNGGERMLQTLRGLSLGAANAPFLRIRNWQLWRGLWLAILDACSVAARVSLGRADAHRGSTERELARIIRLLQPEVVRHMDDSEALQEVVRFARGFNSSTIDESIALMTDAGPLTKAATLAAMGRIDPNGLEIFD